MAQIGDGDKVQIHYTGRLEDGTVFDSSDGGDPLEFTAGSEDLIEGVSRGVIGLKEGEETTLTVVPDKGYGPIREDLQSQVPLEDLPEGVKEGDQLLAKSDDDEFRVFVLEVTDDSALVDANHPLAGKTLIFDIRVVSVVA